MPRWLPAALLCIPLAAVAHELQHSVTDASATVITIDYPSGEPFAYENYELRFPGDRFPFQSGRTDARGRIAFVPNRAGQWRLRVFSEDGHGLATAIDVDSPGVARPTADSPGGGRSERVLAGVGFIFGLFGLLALFRRRGSG